MKRFLCVVCVVALLLSGCSVPEPETTTNRTHGIYELTFNASEVSNDSVGNDWTITYTYNDKTVKNGHQILLPLELSLFQTIGVEVREDDKQDDVGTGEIKVAICDGGSGKTTITVTENGGRYKGNIALWEITCTVKLIGTTTA